MLNELHAVVIDEEKPSAALAGLVIDKAAKDRLIAAEADALQRIASWKMRLRCDRGLAFLGLEPRWPHGADELAQADADIETLRETMLGLGLAGIVLHDESLERQRNDVSDPRIASLANRAIGTHRERYASILHTLTRQAIYRRPPSEEAL